MHVDTDDLATLLKMQHLDLEAMRDKKKLEELPQRAVILEARSKKKAIEQKRAQLDALHAKADAQLSRIDDEDRSLSEKQRQVQSEIDAVRGDYRGVEARTKELNGFAKRRNTLEADLTAVGDELAKIEGVQAQVASALESLERQEAEATAAFVKEGGALKDALARIEAETGVWASLAMDEGFEAAVRAALVEVGASEEAADKAVAYAAKNALGDTDRTTFQAMEALVHNLNTMHSRAGAQTPFSSVNYGMDTSPEGRMVVKNMLLATEEGLGSGETPIFPVQIFRVKEGVNYNPEDPNYDLFKLAMHCSAKRLFPNFSFIDAPFNAQYYKGTPETEIAYMGCRTRVMGNVYDPDREIAPGRGNLSFTSINLPRLAIRSKGDLDLFFDLLDAKLALAVGQLDERFEIQARKHVYNAPFLMGQGVWIDSEKLAPTDEQREVLKHGTLSLGFIGLAETLVALTGKHHGESKASQNLGLEIIGHMRSYLDRLSQERGLNYGLIATPAEGLSGRFVRMDRERYGSIPGITDRDYYTNGFHVPVYYDISAFDKIEIEAPYHALTNAGHISYVELDGDPSENLEAFEAVIRHMKESGIGYGSVNHPVDRDPVCGYNGIIGDVCPKCGRTEAEHGQSFERIRRITGYLVGTLDRFNDAKRAEEGDRVKHQM